MEREKGIEPSLLAWKAKVLPLNYSRKIYDLFKSLIWWAGKDSNPRSETATDLQSVLVDHLSTCPNLKKSWREASNPRPADYKSAALPTELRQQNFSKLEPFYNKLLITCKEGFTRFLSFF